MNMRSPRFSGLGVRARTTLIATGVVGLVLALSGVLLIVATRAALYRSVEATVTARSADVASQVSSGTTPAMVPLIRGISVQILVGGAVVSSTADIEGQSPILDVSTLSASASLIQVPSLDATENEGQGQDQVSEGTEGPFLVAVTVVGSGYGQATILAAAPLVAVANATGTMIPLLALGVPAITLLVGLTVWRLTRRAFRPVEAMADRADAISYTDLHLRIPEPQADDEIRRLSLVLNRMLERLESSVARQRRLTADAGHELKSPVTTLLTMGEVAEANPAAFSVPELAADVVVQSRRLAALVEDLLVLARTDEDRLSLDQQPIDLAEVVLGELDARATTGISIDTESVEPVEVSGDRRRLSQVVGNLLDNAIRHADSMVRLESHSSVDGGFLRVADDGPGIPLADRERVFERFVRLDEARSREAGGTGLGLSVARSIVEAHGGTVSIDSDAELGGAQVTVVLPSPTRDG